MDLTVFELYKSQSIRLPSSGRCIYCGDNLTELRDEHIIPYALGANALILEKSCCETCQNIIQPYEQEVLKKQLGIFRAQMDAPTRNKKDRPTHANLHFIEVDNEGKLIRDLGYHSVPIDELPISLHLWQSPMPRRLREPLDLETEIGRPWLFVEGKAANAMCDKIRRETGATHVAYKFGEVNRLHYLRSLAKTAHAFATAKYGMDTFEPFLLDLILGRSHDVAEYVGDDPSDAPVEDSAADTVQIFLGEPKGGPESGLIVARLQLYPTLGSPAHLIVVGKAKSDNDKRDPGSSPG